MHSRKNEQAFACFAIICSVFVQTLPMQERANRGKARYNFVQVFPFGTAH